MRIIDQNDVSVGALSFWEQHACDGRDPNFESIKVTQHLTVVRNENSDAKFDSLDAWTRRATSSHANDIKRLEMT